MTHSQFSQIKFGSLSGTEINHRIKPAYQYWTPVGNHVSRSSTGVHVLPVTRLFIDGNQISNEQIPLGKVYFTWKYLLGKKARGCPNFWIVRGLEEKVISEWGKFEKKFSFECSVLNLYWKVSKYSIQDCIWQPVLNTGLGLATGTQYRTGFGNWYSIQDWVWQPVLNTGLGLATGTQYRTGFGNRYSIQDWIWQLILNTGLDLATGTQYRILEQRHMSASQATWNVPVIMHAPEKTAV